MKDIAKGVVYAGIFLVPAIVLIISNSMFFPFITGKNFTFRIIVEVIFAAWIILALYDAQYRPRFSWILASFAGLLGVMFFANIFGEHPQSSFWSNFERMEGYVTLVHAFLYVVVLGSVMKTREIWDKYFLTVLGVAVIVMLYAFAQLSGNITIHQGGLRLDGTLGNSAYMAIYTLFLTFFTALMLVRTKSRNMRIAYGVFGLILIYLLIQTATRGTALGLIGGSLVAATYIALFSREYPAGRKYAIWAIGVVLAIAAAFIAIKDTSFVQGNPYLARIANITLEEGKNRFNIWGMALQGVQERPILGWGQGNYNYVFNEYFKPELHAGEAWFDRAHNIVVDWLIAGGVVGLVAYFALFGSALWYIAIRPIFRPDDTSFSITERGIFTGLLAGYLVHNMFVFDNIVSYIFYATVLGYIHSRVARPQLPQNVRKIDARIVDQVAAPLVAIGLILTVYYVNVPAIRAASDIIEAFRATDPEEVLANFEIALSHNSFGQQEIREQFMQRMQSLAASPEVSDDFKQRAFQRVEEELMKQSEEKPGDARIEVFISVFYRATGRPELAAERLLAARALSPNKQVIMFEQGFTELDRNNREAALGFFKEAFDLTPQFVDIRNNYANAALYVGDMTLWNELVGTEEFKLAYALDDNAVRAVYTMKLYPELIELFMMRIAERPGEAQERANLAYIYDEIGESDKAIEVLKQAIIDIPSFKDQAEQFITNIELKAAATTSITVE